MTTIATPWDLWQHLCTSAGLELRLKGGALGRDADIEDAVRKCLSVPATADSLANWLTQDAASSAPSVSTEQLLIAVLKSQGGFALMMEDILSVLITANACKSTHHLSVEFQFEKVNDPIKATLEQFRELVQRVQRVLARRPKLPNDNVMWPISGILCGFLANSPTTKPIDFPPIAAIASTGNADVDSRLELLNRLVSEFRALWRSCGATRTQVGDYAANMKSNDTDAMVLRSQLYAATDFWDVGVLEGAQEIANQVMSKQLASANALAVLDKALKNIEVGSIWVEDTVQELLDLLTLPAWQRRHELYSVWVGTRLLQVVSSVVPDMHFHPVNGVLSFEFGGSRLASFNWDNKQFDVWAELRSGLVGRSTKRKKGIQPDFRVLQVDLSKSTNAQTVYVLECKHYLQANKSNFVQAASDYARSCPNAMVHVVNHGLTDVPALTTALPAELQANSEFISGATPQQEAVDSALSQKIKRALFPSLALAAPNSVSSVAKIEGEANTLSTGLVGCMQLEWDNSLQDIDLALRIIDPHGQVIQSIDFRTPGELDSPPFAQLGRDVREGPGAEYINISTWNFAHYELIATNYSQTGQLTPTALRCRVITDQGAKLLPFPAGLSTTTHEWKIAKLLVSNGVVTIVEGN